MSRKIRGAGTIRWKTSDGDKGEKGNNGCLQRVFENGYVIGQIYRNDTNLETDSIRYLDFICKENTSMASGYDVYRCVQTHTASSDKAPGNTSYWEKVDENAASAFFTYLIAKGANIKILTGSKFSVMDSSGNVVGCLMAGDYPLFIGASTATDSPFKVSKEGKAYMTNAEISGDLKTGTIGGFTIADGRIGVAVSKDGGYYAQGDGSLVIEGDFFRVGGNYGYVMFGNDVIPASEGGAFTATGRIYNHHPNTGSSYGWDQANYGLFIDVEGGTKNYAIFSDNAVIRGTTVYGTRMKYLSVSSSTYTLDLSQNNVISLYFSSSYNMSLPTASQLASQFGYSSLPSYFAYKFTIIAATNTSSIHILNLYDQNNNSNTLDMEQGDVVEILAMNYPSFIYKILNRYN